MGTTLSRVSADCQCRKGTRFLVARRRDCRPECRHSCGMSSDSTKELAADEVVGAALDIARSAGFAFLVTSATTSGGGVSTRLMQPFAPDDDFTVWLGTSPWSRKVAELRADSTATLAYQALDGAGYASAVCDATIVTDDDARKAHWRDDWTAFFPGGADGEDFVVLCLRARRLEVVSFTHGITPAPYGVKAASVVREGTGWRLAPYASG